MSTMNLHTPEPGWEKRWPREAFDLLKSAPAALVFLFLATVLLGVGTILILQMFGKDPVPKAIIFLSQCAAGSVVIVTFMRMLFKADGHDPMPMEKGALLAMLRVAPHILIAISVIGFGLSLIFSMMPEPEGVKKAIRVATAMDYIQQGVGALTQPFLITWFGGVAAAPLAAGGMGLSELQIVSRNIQRKLISLIPNLSLYAFALLVVLPSVPVVALIPFTPFFLAILYVATREIYGGPGLGKRERERETGRSLAPAA